MKLQSKETKGNLIHNHSIHHVIWKNAVHVILLWNLTYLKFSFSDLYSTKANDKKRTQQIQ